MPDPGIGYLPVTASPYDAAYFAKYQGYAQTTMGRELNAARLNFVWTWYAREVVDVGIGCGQFVEERAFLRPTVRTFGYDVNPAGVAWLKERGLFLDPNDTSVGAATFWDSLEHIANPQRILRNVMDMVFVSLPIFNDLSHVLASKHYRPDEHCWYFTAEGFRWFMEQHGWDLLEVSDFETRLGREDILTFAFERRRGRDLEP